ncbi:MAG TPA: hypothetical protein VN310_00370 [Candidatus Dormibacteraeota bacterium]|jgi:hypothetical protein|nr:hypothetical protein [Candidatus Dormibacteraeota bacterium]
MKLAIAGLILACAASASAQKLTVKIINRQDNETEYTYVVAGRFNSQSNSNVDCNAGDNTLNCNGSTTTTGSSLPAKQVSYRVRGATFTLQLPDGRAAVVNCESKFKERMAGPQGNRRSCHIPLVDDIQAEFHGDNAKLVWVVSLDGKKTQSETYKILAILDAPRSSPDPEDSSLDLGQIFKMAVASCDDVGDRYLIVFFTPGKPESSAKGNCLKKRPDCRQLTMGKVYDVVFLDDSDAHRYTDAPISFRVFGAGEVSGRPASAVYAWK